MGTGADCALAGQHERARCLRRGVAGSAYGGIGLGGLLFGVGFERDLAPVVRDTRCKRADAAVFELLRVVDGSTPVPPALVQRQQREPRLGVERGAFECLIGLFGTVCLLYTSDAADE